MDESTLQTVDELLRREHSAVNRRVVGSSPT
jgi:hypothetical protein